MTKKNKMLIDKYNDIFQNPISWKYYSRLTITENPFNSSEAANKFIKEYIEAGEKGSIFQHCEDRSIHTVSVFFLGLLLNRLNLVAEEEGKPKFLYFWFLICLCHDFGYSVENNKIKFSPKIKLKHLLDKLTIEYDLLKEKSSLKFSSKTIKQYYNYCRYKLGFVNHGIIGGLTFYDGLTKNYYKNREEHGFSGDSFERFGLRWRKSDIENFKKIADVIICHNIWYATDEKNWYNYKRHKLDELILRQESPRLSCSGNDALLFLLLLTDTIDPVKFFNQLSPTYVLKNIDIKIMESTKSIEIIVTDYPINFTDWFRSIEKLEEWLFVKIVKESKRKIVINIL